MNEHVGMKGKKIAALLLIICLLALIPMLGLAQVTVSERKADPSTADGWRSYFGPDIKNTWSAGGIWTDKSVFTSVPSGNLGNGITMSGAGDSFLVALSAIASNKSITGYEHIPTDTIIVLDMSSSMYNSNSIGELAEATNAALTQLLALNKNNRVGVVMYSGNKQEDLDEDGESATTILMPLDRYDTNLKPDSNGVIPYLLSKDTLKDGKKDTIYVNTGVYKGGSATAYKTSDRKYMTGTFIQDGIYVGMMELLRATTTVESGLQAGVARIPAFILMTDGKPTAVSHHFAGKAGTGNVPVTDGRGGNNFSVYNSLGGNIGVMDDNADDEEMAFLTQLTASYAREMIDRHYGRAPLFYTLGFNISSTNFAYSVMNPTHSTDRINALWEKYLAASNGASVKINDNVSVIKNEAAVRKGYVDKYTSADSGEMTDAFEDIVQQIILQSLYYPTQAEVGYKDVGGYIEFLDDVGLFMEVKSIKGIQLGNVLYSGLEFAKSLNEGDLGTLENRTDLGDHFVWSVQERLGITGDQARDLIDHAFRRGELSYINNNNWSNYIKWYADASGNYLPFGSEEIPTGAVKEIKSYGMLGKVVDETGHRETNMMYVTIRVEKDISSGAQQVVWKVPATLIPLYSYKIELSGNSISDGENVTVTTTDSVSPIRLIYEVGLRSDITEFNLDQIVEDTYKYKNSDGSYYFYSNQWNDDPSTLDDHPKGQINMVTWFEPSEENERYYYTENSTVFEKTASGYTAYRGSKPSANGEYYRRYIVFEGSGSASATAWSATATYQYERISAAALSDAKQASDNTWYIPKGEIHRYYEPYQKAKADNSTETLGYAAYPTVEDNEHGYYADTVLGNNGRMKVTPSTGLRISKTVSSGDRHTSFPITISGAKDGSYAAQYLNADGTVNESKKTLTFENGNAEVSLKHGEVVTVVGLPAGDYTVTEHQLVHWLLEDVKVENKSVEPQNMGTAVDVADGQIVDIEFVNGVAAEGSLTLYKEVDLNNHVMPQGYDPEFTFKVTLNANTVLEPSYQTSMGTDVSIENDSFTVKVGMNESISIYELPVGTHAIIETDVPPGFTPDQQNPSSVTIAVSGDNATGYVRFKNTYDPVWPDHDPDYDDVSIELTKVLSGRDWKPGESFEFKLERLGTEKNETIGSVSFLSDKDATANGTLTGMLRADIAKIKNPGEYRYHIHEVAPARPAGGMSYERFVALITVKIIDDNGVMRIADVAASQLGSVSVSQQGGDTTWMVSARFTNTYVITQNGVGDLDIDITKHFVDAQTFAPIDHVLSRSGYTFVLYDEGGNALVSTTTDESGKATLLYQDITTPGEKTYTLRELDTATGAGKIGYDKAVWTIKADVVDNLDGTLTASVKSVAYQNGSGRPAATHADNRVDGVTFVNTYVQEQITVPVNVLKVVNNITSKKLSPEGFTFVLEDEQGAIVARATSDADGHAALTLELKEADIGTRRFTLYEEPGTVEHVVYSTVKYPLEIAVSRNTDGTLSAAVTSGGVSSADMVFEFENIYGDKSWLDIPKTGDESNLLLYAAAVVMALGALIMLRRRVGRNS